jgi:hypothetical protein
MAVVGKSLETRGFADGTDGAKIDGRDPDAPDPPVTVKRWRKTWQPTRFERRT